MIRLLLVTTIFHTLSRLDFRTLSEAMKSLLPATEKKVWKPGKNITLTSLFQTSTCP